jgi:mRNA interferase HigB
MRILSRKAVREFSKRHPDAKEALDAWYKTTRKALWSNLNEVRADYPHADLVGICVVFNIGGNKYRLISKIYYCSDKFKGKILIRFILTHRAYDQNKWKSDCGCD